MSKLFTVAYLSSEIFDVVSATFCLFVFPATPWDASRSFGTTVVVAATGIGSFDDAGGDGFATATTIGSSLEDDDEELQSSGDDASSSFSSTKPGPFADAASSSSSTANVTSQIIDHTDERACQVRYGQCRQCWRKRCMISKHRPSFAVQNPSPDRIGDFLTHSNICFL